MPLSLLRAGLAAVLLGGAATPAGELVRRDLRPDPAFVVPDSVLVQLSSVDDLARAPDGSLYLADHRFPAVLQLEPSGALRRIIGRSGAGPGEFHSVMQVGVRGDSMWALDPGRVRVSLFPKGGQGVTTIPFGPMARELPASALPRTRAGLPLALLPDGGFLVEEAVVSRENPAAGATHALILRTSRQLEVEDTVASISFAHRAMHFRFREGEAHLNQPFSDDPMAAFSADGQYFVLVYRDAARGSGTDQFTVSLMRHGRTPVYSRQVTYRPRLLPARAVDSVIRMFVEPVDPNWPRTPLTADSLRRKLYRPRYFPPVERVIVGQDGVVWLKVVAATGPASRAEWLALGRDGREIARVTTAPSFRLLEADRTTLWGVEGDPFDVPVLVKYRVEG
jgi:hypothetical protein